jgi:hypothetical protein
MLKTYEYESTNPKLKVSDLGLLKLLSAKSTIFRPRSTFRQSVICTFALSRRDAF